MITRLSHELFDFRSPQRPGEPGLYAILNLVVSVYAVWAAWVWARAIDRWDSALSPTGLGQLVPLDWMMQGSGLAYLLAALVTLLCGLGLWGKGRMSYLAGFACLSLLFCARFSQGKVSHGDNLMGFLLLFLGLARAMYASKQQERRFFWGLAHFYVGFLYVLSACSKLIATGVSWVRGEHLWMWIYERAIDMQAQTGTFSLNPIQVLLLEHHALATALLCGGLLAEACGCLMWFRATRPYIALVLLGMHVGIWFVLDISFLRHAILLCLLTLPLERLCTLRPLRRRGV